MSENLSSQDLMNNINRQVKDILQITGQDEVMQSFVRTDSDEKEEDIAEKEKKVTSFKLHETVGETSERRKSKDTSKYSEQSSYNSSLYPQIGKEYNLINEKRRGDKRLRRHRHLEEVYTDKDRAAAVNLGSRDIKQSLKLKRRQDRSRILEISEEAHPGTLLALGNHELRNKDVKVAISFINKALELNPYDKNALVTRAKCHLLLGEAELALDDAENALIQDKKFIKGIYQKAEALYHLGKFEHSLMYFHRGLHLRPEMEDFRLGVQKAQQAIENTIGNIELDINLFKSRETTENDEIKRNLEPILSNKAKNNAARSKHQSRVLLKELFTDKEYLENLLNNPDIQCANSDNNKIKTEIKESVQFLENRQEFWRQYQPIQCDKKDSKQPGRKKKV